jgi:hypothetical protein
LFSLFATGVIDTGGNLANLPQVSTTPAVLVAKFAAGVIDIGGKFSTGVVDNGGEPSLANILANFLKNVK